MIITLTPRQSAPAGSYSPTPIAVSDDALTAEIVIYRDAWAGTGTVLTFTPRVSMDGGATWVTLGECADVGGELEIDDGHGGKAARASTSFRFNIPPGSNRMVSANYTTYTTLRVGIDIIVDRAEPESDWSDRSGQDDVVMATNFTVDSEVTNYKLRATDHPNYNLTALDSAVRASGGGSMRMTIPNDQGIGGTSDWRRNFADTSIGPAKKFGAGEKFYTQWRQRFSAAHLDNVYALSSGRGGWKMINIGDGDNFPWDYGDAGEAYSAQTNELVMNNADLRLFPTVYHSIDAFVSVDQGIDSNSVGGYTYDSMVQNAIDRGAQYPLNERYVLQSSFRNNDPVGDGGPFTYSVNPPKEHSPSVQMFYPNEWMTFQVGVTLGPLGTAPSSIEGSAPISGWTDSRIEVWVAREGLPSKKITDVSGITLRRAAGVNAGDPEGYGKVWFTTFHTGLIADLTRAVGETWFDELIVSSLPIKDPIIGEYPERAFDSVQYATGWTELANSTIRAVSLPDYWNGDSYQFGFYIPEIFSWSGGAYDTKRNRLLMCGGGHSNYYGNEVYASDINAQTTIRLTDPAPTNWDNRAAPCPRELAPNDGTQPNARHTYDCVAYMPVVDSMFLWGGSLSCDSGGGASDTWWFDCIANTWQLKAPTGTVPPTGVLGSCSCWDTTRNVMWLLTRGRLFKYDPSVGTEGEYTQVKNYQTNIVSFHTTMIHDPVRDILYLANGAPVGTYDDEYYIDLTGTPTYDRLAVTTAGGGLLKTKQGPGLTWDSVNQQIVGWAGGNSIHALDWATKTWAEIALTGAAIPDHQPTGTYKRFAFSPDNNAFILYNDVDQNIFVAAR